MKSKRIALFASGNGSNVLNIIKHFEQNSAVEIAFVLANSSKAGVIESAKNLGVQTIICSNVEAADETYFKTICKQYSVDFIVLAGFLRKIPSTLIQAFQDRIINIHPSLLPKYGGKGMYGKFVHEAVALNKEKESGITIHFVNEDFDKGRIISQFSVELNENESVASIQAKVQKLEHQNFANIIEKIIVE